MVMWSLLQLLLTKIKSYAAGIIASLLGLSAIVIYFLKTKNDVDEALLHSDKLEKQIDAVSTVIQKNDDILKTEEEKRKALADEQNLQESITDLAKFFNDRK